MIYDINITVPEDIVSYGGSRFERSITRTNCFVPVYAIPANKLDNDTFTSYGLSEFASFTVGRDETLNFCKILEYNQLCKNIRGSKMCTTSYSYIGDWYDTIPLFAELKHMTMERPLPTIVAEYEVLAEGTKKGHKKKTRRLKKRK